MIVYQSDSHKFVIVTEQRTGSSFLFHLQHHCDIEVWEDQDPLAKMEKIKDIHNEGYTIYVAGREPVGRRASAISMLSFGNTVDQKANYMRGRIASEMEKRVANTQAGLPNFTLSDSHLDWGTSIYYYLIRASGVHCRMILVDTCKYFDWYDRFTDDVFTMDQFMRPRYKHIPEALEYLDGESSHRKRGVMDSLVWMLNKNDHYHKGSSPLPLKPSEGEYMFLYHAYTKAFREMSNDLKYDTIDITAKNKLLPIDTWTNLESVLFTRMATMENDLSLDSSQRTVIANKTLWTVLQRLNEYVNWETLATLRAAPDDNWDWFPCCNLHKLMKGDPEKYIADLFQTE